jgi:SAM-dependent methyltransferase
MRTMCAGVIGEEQLRRQSAWLSESWLWLLDTKGPLQEGKGTRRPTALDVGCGPGLVMELLASRLQVKGVDLDQGMARRAREKGLDVAQGNAYQLPFPSASFDIVYCSFLLLWTKEPEKAVKEMGRVARHWVICLAEPDYGGRIDHPLELLALKDLAIKGLQDEGADPFMGRKLRSVFSGCGLEAEIGQHPGVWDMERLYQEGRDEMLSLESARDASMDASERARLEQAWDQGYREGTLFQFNPVFYALASK